MPNADKSVIKILRPYLGNIIAKIVPPVRQRTGIVGAEIFGMGKAEVG